MITPKFQSAQELYDWEKVSRMDDKIEDLEAQEARLLQELENVRLKKEDIQSRRDLIARQLNIGVYQSYSEDLNAINDLIQACNMEVTNELISDLPTDTSIELSQAVVDKLNECDNVHPDLITAILFVFGFSGGNIDLNKIKDLDVNNAEDWRTVEELRTFLNDKIEDAIGLIDSRLGNVKNIFLKKRIAQIRQAVKDFEPMKELVPPLAA